LIDIFACRQSSDDRGENQRYDDHLDEGEEEVAGQREPASDGRCRRGRHPSDGRANRDAGGQSQDHAEKDLGPEPPPNKTLQMLA